LDQPGLGLAVENARDRGLLTRLAPQRGVQTVLDQARTRPVDSRDTGIERLNDPLVAPTLARFRNVRLEQNPSLEDFTRRALALADRGLQRGSFLLAPDW
jgi:hypothetical protein